MLRFSVHRGGRTSEVTVQVNSATGGQTVADFRFIFAAYIH